MPADSTTPHASDPQPAWGLSGRRLIAIANVLVVLSGVLSVIPTYSVGARTMEAALASADIKRIRVLVETMQDGFSAYGVLFLVCFGLLIASSVLLWKAPGTKAAKGES